MAHAESTGASLALGYDDGVVGKEQRTAPVLRRAPVVEALLELQFAPAANLRSYGPIPGQMYERLKSDYPSVQDLEAAEMPLSLALEIAVVRHRFTSSDGFRMFQVGNGVLSVNRLKYEHYDGFRAEAAKVIATALDVYSGPATRAMLRYINKIPTQGRNLDQVLTAAVSLPANFGQVRGQQTMVRVVDEGSGSEIHVTWGGPIDNQADLVLLDLSAHKLLPEEAWSADQLLSWMDAAHDLIESRFLAMIRPEFLEEMK